MDHVKIISSIYEAAAGPSIKPLLGVCDDFAGMLNSRADGMSILNTRSFQLDAVESNIDPAIVADYV